MTKNIEKQNSLLRGKRGSFYFTPFLTPLKKFFLRQNSGQAAMEYFILLFAILSLVLLSNFIKYNQIKRTARDFYNKTAIAIMDSSAPLAGPPSGCGYIEWEIYEGIRFRKDGSSSSLSYDQYNNLINCSFAEPTDWGLFCSDTKICPGLNDSGNFTVKWKGCEYTSDWRQCNFRIVN